MEELARLQSQYCKEILEENKYNKIIYDCKDPIVAGFLYNKFSKAEEKGIQTQYHLNTSSEEKDMDVFDLIEMLGILYDNAVDALTDTASPKEISVGITKSEGLQYQRNGTWPWSSQA